MPFSAEKRREIVDLGHAFLAQGAMRQTAPVPFMLALVATFNASVEALHELNGAPLDVMAAFRAATEVLQEGTPYALVETDWSDTIPADAKAN